MTDLSGVRIIAYLETDCDVIVDLVKKEFVVDQENSVYKNSELQPDQFGYQSTHLIVKHAKSRNSLTKFKRFDGLYLEIQVKTILQHAWAAIDWKLRYKNPVEAPPSLRRRLYRISALLEAADDEFLRVSNDAASIRRKYQESIFSGNLQVGIDKDSLEEFFASKPQEKLIDDVKSQLAESDFLLDLTPPSELSFSRFFSLMSELNINTIKELNETIEESIKKNKDKITEQWKNWGKSSSKTNNPDLFRTIILLNLDPDDADRVLENNAFSDEFTAALKKTIRSK